MSSIISSQGVVFATAMAVSGTVILLAAFRSQKPTQFFTINQNSNSTSQVLRSCISLDGKRKEKKKKKKRVHFADDVVDSSSRSSEEFRRECRKSLRLNQQECGSDTRKNRLLPANRMALYNGILRDRVRRTTCSY